MRMGDLVVNIHEAKTHLSRLLERVRKGQRVVIAKAGKPCAVLSPLPSSQPRTPGTVKGYVDEQFFEPLPDEELGAWES